MIHFLHLSQTTLSPAAASGAVARDLGYLPRRQTTPPAGLIQGWRRFLDNPGKHIAAPKPSVHHPMNRPHPRPAA